MIIGILAEYTWNSLERRVALVPETVAKLVKRGFQVIVQRGAGIPASIMDERYEGAGAVVASSAGEVIEQADVLCMLSFIPAIAEHIRSGQIVITLVQWHRNGEQIQQLRTRGVYILALESIPRTSRAQAMDVLTSMATVAGYRAVMLAAERLPRFFPMIVSAAGTMPPAECVILGAGVAGLQAIATARRLGAIVRAYDIRPAAQEQIASLGAQPISIDLEIVDAETRGGYAIELAEKQLQRQQEGLAPFIARADVVITTAAVPGKRAPVLITRAMLDAMKSGSVVVDLAAESGGNTEATQPGGDVILPNGVHLLAPVLLPAQVPEHASLMFSQNLGNLLMLFARGEKPEFHMEDDILQTMSVS